MPIKVLYYTNKPVLGSITLDAELQQKDVAVTLLSHCNQGKLEGVDQYSVIPDYRIVTYREGFMQTISEYFKERSLVVALPGESDLQEALRYRIFFAGERYFFLLHLYEVYIESGEYDIICMDLEYYDTKLTNSIFKNYKNISIIGVQASRINIWIKIIHFIVLQAIEWLLSKKSIPTTLVKKPFISFFEFVPRNINLIERIAERLPGHIGTLIVAENVKTARIPSSNTSVKLWLGDLLSLQEIIRIFFTTLWMLWKIASSTSKKTDRYSTFFSKIIITLNYKDLYFALVASTGLAKLIKNSQCLATSSTSIVQPYVRSGLIIANQVKKPTFLIQHGTTTSLEYECHIIQKHMLAWGVFNQKKIEKNTKNTVKVSITGYTKAVSANYNSQIRPATEKKRITYFPTTIEGSCLSASDSFTILELLKAAVLALPEYRFTIRPKPGTPMSFYTGYEQFLDEALSTETQLMRSEIVLTTTTTVGIEACFYGKNLVLLCLPGIDPSYYNFYQESGAALLVKDLGELIQAIDAIEHNPEIRRQLAEGRARLIREMFTPDIINPIERAAQIILAEVHEN